MTWMTRCRRSRAYLLMEVMVGGVIVATGLMAAAAGVARMRHQSEVASREVTAAQLMVQKIEQVRSLDYSQLGAMTTFPLAAPEVINMHGTYERSFERTLVPAVAGPPPIPAHYDFTITVAYQLHHEIRDISTTITIYDPN